MSFPGFFFAHATSSAMLFGGKAALAITMCGVSTRREMPINARDGFIVSLSAKVFSLIALVVTLPTATIAPGAPVKTNDVMPLVSGSRQWLPCAMALCWTRRRTWSTLRVRNTQ